MSPEEFEKYLDQLPDDTLVSLLGRPVSIGIGILGVGVAFGALLSPYVGNLVGGSLVIVGVLGWVVCSAILAKDGI